MSIDGPGNKRPHEPQSTSDEVPEKQPRTEHHGRSIHEEAGQAFSRDSEHLAEAGLLASEEGISDRQVSSLSGADNSGCTYDPGLICGSLHMLHQLYDTTVGSDLLLCARTPGSGQQVAITLVNYLEYLNDCQAGVRQLSEDMTHRYLEAVTQACHAFSKGTAYEVRLEKDNPLESLHTDIEREWHIFHQRFYQESSAASLASLAEPPEWHVGSAQDRVEMRDFLSFSSSCPFSPIEFLKNLANITGQKNFHSEQVKVIQLDHVMVHDDEVFTRRNIRHDEFPVLEIKCDGRDLPACFANTYHRFKKTVVNTGSDFVNEAGEKFPEGTVYAPYTTEYFLEPSRQEAVFFIHLELDSEFWQKPEIARGIVLDTCEPFTCSNLMRDRQYQAVITGLLCLSGNRTQFEHKYLNRAGDAWQVINSTGNVVKRSLSLSEAFEDVDRPVVLVCKFHKPTLATLPDQQEEVSTLLTPFSPSTPFAPSTPFTPSGFLTSTMTDNQEGEVADAGLTEAGSRPDSPAAGSDRESSRSSSPDSSAGVSVNLPALSEHVRETLEQWRETGQSLEGVFYSGFDCPIPALPGLKPDIKDWNADLISYVTHQYRYDQDDGTGRVFHNPRWHLHALRILREDSAEYLETLQDYLKAEWQNYQSVPSLYYRLRKNEVSIPPLEGIPEHLHGTCNWNQQLIAQLLMSFCNLSESPLEPHPLVHEIIRSLEKGYSIQEMISLQNKRMTVAKAVDAPCVMPLQDSDFRAAPKKWSGAQIRYLAHQHENYIKARCNKTWPDEWTFSDLDRITMFKVDHQQVREALKRMTENALKNDRSRATFFQMMHVKAKLLPNQIPWCPMTDKAWGMGALNSLGRHFGLITQDVEAPAYQLLINDVLAASKRLDPYNLAHRLNRESVKNPAYKPPHLDRLEFPPDSWSTALVKVYASQVHGDSLSEFYKPLPDDYLQIYAPHAPEYLQGVKDYLQRHINTCAPENLHFQGLLDLLNSAVKSRGFMVRTPVIDELPEAQRGVTPWTREMLQTVIDKVGLENVPENRGCGALEILKSYLSRPTANSIGGITKRLNRTTALSNIIPVPDTLKALLIAPRPSSWDRALTRLAIALYLATTPEAQAELPAELQLRKVDVAQIVKPEKYFQLPPHIRPD